ARATTMRPPRPQPRRTRPASPAGPALPAWEADPGAGRRPPGRPATEEPPRPGQQRGPRARPALPRSAAAGDRGTRSWRVIRKLLARKARPWGNWAAFLSHND